MRSNDTRAIPDLSNIESWLAQYLPEEGISTIEFIKSGFDNQNYLINGKYLLRIPKTLNSEKLIRNEIQWLPRLSGKFDIATPQLIRHGISEEEKLCALYSWTKGLSAMTSDLKQNEWPALIEFLKTLHDSNKDGAPLNLNRGVPLKNKSERFFKRFESVTSKIELAEDQIKEVWNEAVSASLPSKKHLIHGDLHPDNVITDNGRLVGIIDWGDITSGDSSTDLASIWMLFNDSHIRQLALNSYGADTSATMRAMGWALFFSIVFLDYGLDHDKNYFKRGSEITSRVLSDFDSMI